MEKKVCSPLFQSVVCGLNNSKIKVDEERDDETFSRDILRNDFYEKKLFFHNKLKYSKYFKELCKIFRKKNILV